MFKAYHKEKKFLTEPLAQFNSLTFVRPHGHKVMKPISELRYISRQHQCPSYYAHCDVIELGITQ